MNNWKTIRPVVLTISIALNVTFLGTWALYAWRSRRTMHRQHPRFMRDQPEHGEREISCPMHREIGVTEEQWQEMEPMLDEFWEKTEENARRIRAHRDALMDELSAPEPNMERIEKYQKKIGEGQSNMRRLVIERLLKQKKVLTPEQQERLFEMMKKRMGFPAERRGLPGSRSNAGDSLIPLTGMLRLCHSPDI